MQRCPSEEQLARYVAGACVDDEAARVRSHIEQCGGCARWVAEAEANDAILDSVCGVLDAEAEDAADRKAGQPATLKVPDPLIGKSIGGFQIESVIAAGGMGTVYLAQQDQPRRDVALKIMKRSVASRSALRRFQFESQVLGRLRHPNIAQVYDAGMHDDPGAPGELVPYFAMEFIPDAQTITHYAKSNKLGTRERLELFAHVCEAVHHGHQKGIIHRDLKPSNILVDASGQVKIIDFGVARATDSDLAVTTLRTDVGQLIGTLQYMSPEQCKADPQDLDTRSDVYSLGVVLYELLCGQLPYDVSDTTLVEAARTVCEDAPARLSTIDRTLRGDVETIVLKALEKDRDQRYHSATEFAEDVRRYLSNKPIVARPPSTWYQFAKFTRRNKVLVGGIAAVFVVLVAGIVGTTIGMVRASGAEHKALQQAYFANINAAQHAMSAYDPAALRRNLDAAPVEWRDWEWNYLNAQSDHSLNVTVLEDDQVSITCMAFSPDRTRLASGSLDGAIRIWDSVTGEELNRRPGGGTRVQAVTFGPAGIRLAVGTNDGTLRIWDTSTGKELRVPLAHEAAVDCVAFSPDGTRLASGSCDGTARIWDAYTGDQLGEPRVDGGAVTAVGFSPDGTRLASASEDRTVRIWDASTGKKLSVLRGHDSQVGCVAFNSNGTRVASGAFDGTVRVWDTFTGQEVPMLEKHAAAVRSLAFSQVKDRAWRAGSHLVSGSADGTVRI